MALTARSTRSSTAATTGSSSVASMISAPPSDIRPLLFYRGAYLSIEEDVVDPTPTEELANFITSADSYTWL